MSELGERPTEVPIITFEHGLEVAGQFEIDNAITVITEIVGDRQLISRSDIDEIIDVLLDRRNDLTTSYLNDEMPQH